MAEPAVLVDITKAIARLQINSELTESISPNLNEAILGSQLRLESAVETSFQKRDYVDVFYLDPDMFSGMQPGGYFTLLLSAGFLTDDPVVQFGEPDILGETPLPQYFKVNKAKGHVKIKAYPSFFHKHVTVTYSAGFNSPDKAPDWLKEAIASYAPVLFYAGGSQDDAKAIDGYRVMADHALAIVAPHHRRVGFAMRPIYSV